MVLAMKDFFCSMELWFYAPRSSLLTTPSLLLLPLSSLLSFVTRMLALAPNTLPSRGIRAIPQQLEERLPTDTIRLNSRVETLAAYGEEGRAGEGQGSSGRKAGTLASSGVDQHHTWLLLLRA